MKRIIASFLLSVMLMVSSPIASAAPRSNDGSQGQTTTLGYDISYPQCTKTITTIPAFTIVGVNGGKASTVNECLTQQLTWAAKSTGKAVGQDKIQLYVNTASPGQYINEISTWPANNADPTGQIIENPNGDCSNDDSVACAWMYGYNRAYDDVQLFFMNAANKAGVSNNPLDYYWWLDVETLNTWQPGSAPDGYKKNIASLEGMVSYFDSLSTDTARARVGLYSTTYQWNQITGHTIGTDSPLYNRSTWYALGNTNLATAQAACTKQRPLVEGGQIVLTQFIVKNLDHNYACPPSVRTVIF
jgi:hypothetical protein